VTFWKAVVLAAIEVSVVPVASKNIRNGETPVVRTVLTFSVRGPLVTGHATPLTGGGAEGAEAIDTVTLCVAEPPVPVQTRVNFVVAVRAEVLAEPLVGSDPLQPPDAVHDVALVADQVREEAAPLATVVGLAVSVMAGV
jgi:hypothetical protein